MNTLTIFGVQLVISLLVYALIAKWYAAPWLAKKPIHLALIALIFPHAFRHLGLVFLVPGLVAEPLPNSFAFAAAYGATSRRQRPAACCYTPRRWTV